MKNMPSPQINFKMIKMFHNLYNSIFAKSNLIRISFLFCCRKLLLPTVPSQSRSIFKSLIFHHFLYPACTIFSYSFLFRSDFLPHPILFRKNVPPNFFSSQLILLHARFFCCFLDALLLFCAPKSCAHLLLTSPLKTIMKGVPSLLRSMIVIEIGGLPVLKLEGDIILVLAWLTAVHLCLCFRNVSKYL